MLVGIRLGDLPPSAIPANPPSEPGKNPYFDRAAISDTEMLKEQAGLRPAPYLASRGMKWIQHFAKPGLSDAGLRDYIRQSHAIAVDSLKHWETDFSSNSQASSMR